VSDCELASIGPTAVYLALAMAPKAAAIISPAGGTGTASDDSVSPPAPASVQGRQKKFMQALDEASSSPSFLQQKEQARQGDVFPYGITVPFKVRDAVPGNKCASARVFLSEAPISALKDMCHYLEMEETGRTDDLVARIVDYFVQLYPDRAKALSKKEKLATPAAGPTPARARTQPSQSGTAKVQAPAPEAKAYGGGNELRAQLEKLGKPTYGTKETLLQRLQEAQAKVVAKVDVKKRRNSEEPIQAPALKKKKSTENLQNQYCVAGLSIAAQMKLAMQQSME